MFQMVLPPAWFGKTGLIIGNVKHDRTALPIQLTIAQRVTVRQAEIFLSFRPQPQLVLTYVMWTSLSHPC